MPGSRKVNLQEMTSGSCLENSNDFKHCFGLEVEATVEPGHRAKIFIVCTLPKYSVVLASCNCSVTPEVEGHSSAESTNLLLFVTQRSISRG